MVKVGEVSPNGIRDLGVCGGWVHLLLVEPSFFLVALGSVDVVKGTDDEVCDNCVGAVFFDIEGCIVRMIHVCHDEKETSKETSKREQFKTKICELPDKVGQGI
jgi:hypothetical protein